VQDETLYVEVRDDGIGGADPDGTLLAATLPLSAS
jgi:hypothetical protein